MSKRNNIDAYISLRIEKELNKKLNTIINKKIRQLQLGSVIKHSAYLYNRNSFHELTKKLYHAQFADLNLFNNFGISDSQFINTFSAEIKKSIFKDI